MANVDHIEWLLAGAEDWNKRRGASEFIPNFENANIFEEFRKRDLLDYKGQIPLAGYDLSDANFRNSNLFNADFHNTRLDGADFEGATVVSTFSLATGQALDFDRLFAIEFGGLVRWYRLNTKKTIKEKDVAAAFGGSIDSFERLRRLEGGYHSVVDDDTIGRLSKVLGIEASEIALIRQRVAERLNLLGSAYEEAQRESEVPGDTQSDHRDDPLVAQAKAVAERIELAKLISGGVHDILKVATSRYRQVHNELPEDIFIIEEIEKSFARVNFCASFESNNLVEVLLVEIDGLKKKVAELNAELRNVQSSMNARDEKSSLSAWEEGKKSFAKTMGAGTAAALLSGSAFFLGSYGQSLLAELGVLLDTLIDPSDAHGDLPETIDA